MSHPNNGSGGRPPHAPERGLGAAEVARRLGGKRSGAGFVLRCPAHEDKNPSLSISDRDDGGLLVRCHAGCQQPEVISALEGLGISVHPSRRAASRSRKHSWKPTGTPVVPIPEFAPPFRPSHNSRGVWTYHQMDGKVVAHIERVERGVKKDYYPKTFCRFPDGSTRWATQNLEGKWPLYGLFELVSRPSADVVIPEGEKAVEGARKRFPNCVVVTSKGGASAVGSTDWAPLAGRNVVIWRDNDDTGHQYQERVIAELRRTGAASIKTVTLDDRFPPKWDLADALPSGVDAGALQMMLAQATPVYAEDGGEPAAAVATESADRSDKSLADGFARVHGPRLRIDTVAGRWLYFDGHVWQADQTNRAEAALRDYLHAAHRLGSAKTHRAVMMYVRMHDALVTTPKEWNADPRLLGTPHGVFDLKSGELLPPSARLLVSKMTACAPEGGEPTEWLKFLHRATNGDAELIRYLQQVTGYALSGYVIEHCFWFLIGDGATGKNTFTDTVAAILKDYGWKAASRSLMSGASDRHLSDIAMFEGRRFVYASETSGARGWDMARIKELTGGDPINANRMRQDPIYFEPTHKLIVLGNEAPLVASFDNSMKRRLRVVPFDVVIPEHERDLRLKEKLRDEWPRILSWMLKGFHDWNTNGFVVPKAVTAASAEYFSTQDTLALWLDEECNIGTDLRCGSTPALNSLNRFRQARGDPPMTSKQMAEQLRRKGYLPHKSNGISTWIGFTLRNSNGGEPDDA